MAEPEASQLTAEKKAQLHEVADLMLTIYQTLAKMQYVRPEGIILGPHDITSLRPLYHSLNLSPAVIYLYSILPYIDTTLANARDFFQGGAFFNHLNPRDVEQGRDPCYASPSGGPEDEEGEYMLPGYTPLSECGNHSSIVILDVDEMRAWVIEQIDRKSTDPVFCPGWYWEDGQVEEEKSDWGDDGEEGSWEEDGEDGKGSVGSEGSSEFWEDDEDANENELEELKAERAEDVSYDEGFDIVEEMSWYDRQQAMQLKNQNSLELSQNRDACDVLRDINRYYIELKELPGQGEYTGGKWLKPKHLRPLYLKNGWPDNFDGEGFKVDLARAYCRERAKDSAQEPLRKVQCFEGWSEFSNNDIERYTEEIKQTTNVEEEWMARYQLWQAHERKNRNEQDLREAKAKAERMCPGGKCQKDEDLPLWELERVRADLEGRRDRIKRDDNWKDVYGDDHESIRHLEINHQHNVRSLAVYEKAFIAAKADADRLCPGRTLHDATGIISLGRKATGQNVQQTKSMIESLEKYVAELKEFLATVPETAVKAREKVEREVKGSEDGIVRSQERLKQIENGEHVSMAPRRPLVAR